MIGGLGTIDLQDWKTNTRLKHCMAESPQVIWFWRIVESYSEEMRARLLQFVTGSSRVPLQGFKALQVLNTMFLLAEFNTVISRDQQEQLVPGCSPCTWWRLTPTTYPRHTPALTGIRFENWQLCS